MRSSRISKLTFMALCCALGLSAKKFINPVANIITGSLHIPGGISTGFSLMFLVLAAEVVRQRSCGTIMGSVQGLLALIIGRVGSMGIFMPIAYLMPGIAIDVAYLVTFRCSPAERMILANTVASATAAFVANLFVFHLRGAVLCLYLGVAAISGFFFGWLAGGIAKRLMPIFKMTQEI